MVEARRKWGQHWLANDELAAALVREIGPRPGDRFLEIGPGRGRLTAALLARPVEVVAVEIDPRCTELLRQLEGAERLRVVEADVLGLSWPELDAGDELRVVGNLPYNLASPLLRWTVEHRRRFVDAHYMLPADVAERVLASPGGRDYGLLSVEVQWEFDGEILRRLGPGAFRPPPRIDSAFVRLVPASPPSCASPPAHRRTVVEGAFAHRRKTLANALRHAGWSSDEVESACAAAGVSARARAEDLGSAEYARLADALPQRRPEPSA